MFYPISSRLEVLIFWNLILPYDCGAVPFCMVYMCAHTPFLLCLVLISSVCPLPCIALVDTSPTRAVRRTLQSPFGFWNTGCLAELLQPQALQPLLFYSLILPAPVECSHFWSFGNTRVMFHIFFTL